MRLFLMVFTLLGLSGCASQSPSDFQGTTPVFNLEDYFEGKTRATGIFEDRFGQLRREFIVDIEGSIEGDELILDEHFNYKDGEKDRRIWRIKRIDEHVYEGRADDVIGTARGEAFGNALN